MIFKQISIARREKTERADVIGESEEKPRIEKKIKKVTADGFHSGSTLDGNT